jgi:peptidoglycan/LPS O-acetylase OafA/YrhL
VLLNRDRPATRSRGAEIKALTGLRFVAAAWVVVHHIRPPAGAPAPLVTIIQHGYVGVPLFFMLSGLVLAWNYPDLKPRAGRAVLLFYISRMARVMPLYWAMLAFLVVARAAQNVPQSHLWMHVLGVQTWSGDVNVGVVAYNAPAWSVNVELFLYALFPFLIPLVAKAFRAGRRRALLAVIGLAFSVQWALVIWFTQKGWADLPSADPRSVHRWLYRNPMTRIPDFVMGMCLAFLIQAGTRMRARAATVAQLVLAALIVFIAALDISGSGLWRGAYYGAAWTIPFGCLLYVLAVGERGVLARLLSSRPLMALGLASYALYLTHRPLLPGFFGDAVADAHGIKGWALMGFVLLMATLVAEGAHRYIEVPARAFIVTRARRRLATPPAVREVDHPEPEVRSPVDAVV